MFPIKLIIYAVGGLILAGGLAWGYRAVQNHFVGVENLHTEISNERDRANRAEVSLGALEQTVELRRSHAKELTRIRAESQGKIDQIRETTDKQKEVLQDRDRLKRVTIAKPGLVEKLANRATKRVFNDLEAIYNSN